MWQKPNKYKAIRTVSGFPSKLEESVYGQLKLLERLGEIRDIERYPSVKLMGSIRWKVDFKYYSIVNSRDEWCEAKGVATSDYRIKREIWRCGFGPGTLVIWKGTYKRPFVDEIIYPDKGNI